MNIFTKILFVLLAIIILILGFVLGTFILTLIFTLLVFMTLLFIVIWLFNNIVSLFKNNVAKLIFKFIFSTAITYGLMTILWLLTSKFFLQMNKNIAIGALWIITVCIFGTLWYLLHLKKQRARHQYLWDDYKNTTDKFTALDILVIIVVPTIIVYVFNLVHFI
jgi:hypothetical protein